VEPLTILGLFVTAALLIMGLTAVSNLLFFPRLRRQPEPPAAAPLVSLLVPARNEAAVIGGTVRGLLAQTYPNLELIVLDDHSTDETAVFAQTAAAGDARLTVLNGRSLPPGWLGKNWACQQLAEAAQGEVLIFTDADVGWQPDALPALLAQLDGAAMATVWPTQETHTWGERLVVPLMALAILCYLPVLPVHYAPWPAFAAANGQCLALRRNAYTQIGGHAAVRGNIVEDVGLARLVKRAGLRLRMADGNRLIGCRMYADWPAVRDGFAKNILAGHGNSVPFLLALSTLFHWLVFPLSLGLVAADWLLVGVRVGAGGDWIAGDNGRFHPPTPPRRPAHAPLRPPHDPHRRPVHPLALSRRPALERSYHRETGRDKGHRYTQMNTDFSAFICFYLCASVEICVPKNDRNTEKRGEFTEGHGEKAIFPSVPLCASPCNSV
jgi:chlorobactene glucosyltransferase